jgi:DNA-binding MarR family transcriptional regulator
MDTGRQAKGRPAINVEDLAFRLHSAMLHMMRRVRREDAAFGVSAPRMSALSVVHFGGPRTIGEIARAEQVSAPTMTRLIAGMERDGLVRRKPSPTDGRSVLISATAKGKRIMEEGRRNRVRFLASELRQANPATLRALSEASDALLAIYARSRV